MLKSALDNLSRTVSDLTFMRGQAHYQSGDVLMLRLSDGLLRARIKGDAHQIYNVYMDLKARPQSSPRCSCQDKTGCAHAVAALIALNAREIGDAFDKKAGPNVSMPSGQVVKADDVEWYSESKPEGGGHDFFAYELGIIIKDKHVSIVPLVANLLEQLSASDIDRRHDGETFRLPIADGRILEVTLGRLKPLLKLLLQYGIKRKDILVDNLKLSRYQLLFISEAELAIEASNKRWQGTKGFKAIHQALLNPSEAPQEIAPKFLHAELRAYQKEGLKWLDALRRASLGGILADDMGLGKTMQTLAFLQNEKEAGRMKHASLILAPRSVIGNWYNEAKQFTPELKVLVYHGFSRHDMRDFDTYDVVVSTYGIVQRDKSFFVNYPFYYLVLDEAQVIKNTQTKTRQIIQQLNAEHRLCLTGTPLENHLGELWSLFHFLAPGFLGTQKQFRTHFQNPIEKEQDEACRTALVNRLKPFVLRRSKNQVEEELPEKTEILQTVELFGHQRDLYESIRMTSERSVREAIERQGLSKSKWVFLEALLKLRQVCCDSRLVETVAEKVKSAKLDALLELLDSLIDEGRSVLVFSQFTSMLALIEKALNEREYSYLMLTGKTKNREALIQRFQEGEAPIFLISLRAGGVGLNLTQADTVIHYDPWWNPAVETQATDRTHRIGQDKPVFVYRLIAKGTVEEAMLKMQKQKRALFDGIFSEERLSNISHQWTEEEISAFFMPLVEA